MARQPCPNDRRNVCDVRAGNRHWGIGLESGDTASTLRSWPGTVSDADVPGRIAILLSTYDGERFLAAQLDSLCKQTDRHWAVRWRDDGSTDRSVAVMESFAGRLGPDQFRRVITPAGRLGACASYLMLLAAELADPVGQRAELLAFADQDDVWLPEKLARGRDALARIPAVTPALYCARQTLVDAELQPIGLSFRLSRMVGFPMALTQNIATGCTVMMNAAAARLIAATTPPPGTVHDWWSYLVVSAAGGLLLVDDTPVVLYRQHASNMVGAPSSARRRALAALRRGPGVFMAVFEQHVAALTAHADLLSPAARTDLAVIQSALSGSRTRRLAALLRGGLRRQTWHETLLFRIWFLVS